MVMLVHPLSEAPVPMGQRIAVDTVLNGHAPVILFFVLSGYVLQASLGRTALSATDVARFYLRRGFRIYPAVFAASVLTILVVHALGPLVPATGGWIREEFRVRNVSLVVFALSLAAVSAQLIPPLWTILIELVGSAFMPAFALAARVRFLLWALVAVLALASLKLSHAHAVVVEALGYLVDFALGAALFEATASMRVFMAGRSRLLVAVAAFAAFALVFSRPALKLLTLGHLTPLRVGYWDPDLALVEALFAGLLIAAVVARPDGMAILRARPLAFLGDVSFSVYLLHYPIMLAIACGLAWIPGYDSASAAGPFVLAVLTAAVTLPVAWLSFTLIEMPGVNVGRAAAQRLFARPTVAAA